MFEGIGTALVGVAAEAIVILGKQRGAAANIDGTFVRRVAGGAGKPPFRHGMMAGQFELAAHIEMALEADRFLRAGRLGHRPRAEAAGLGAAGGETVGRLGFAARFRGPAAWAVAGFAARGKPVRPRGFQAGVVSRGEITVELVVALLALLGADVL